MAWLPVSSRAKRTGSDRSHEARQWHRLYSNRRWQRYSKAFLAQHPLCVLCGERGELVAAGCVDHIQPHRGDLTLFWSTGNHRALCIPCNSRKALMEDGR